MKVPLRLWRLAANSGWGWIALVSIWTSISFLVNPDALSRSPIGRTFHPWDYAWTLGYGLAGLLILAGLLAPPHRGKAQVRIEIAGLTLFAMGASLNILALIVTTGASAMTSIGVLLAAVFAAVARALIISSGTDSPAVTVPEGA